MRKIDKFFQLKLLPMLLTLFPISVSAASISFPFTVDPGDKSLAYVGEMLGNIGSVQLGTSSAYAVGEMISKFNGWFLTLAMFIMAGITLKATINTAQQGEALGQKDSTVWTPVRTILGILLMLPYPGSYYSILQTTFMWIILQGVGAANMIWGTALDYYVQGFSPSAVQKVSNSSNLSTFDAVKKDIVPTGDFSGLNYGNSKPIEAGIYENVLCVTMANAISQRMVPTRFNSSTRINERKVATYLEELGITKDNYQDITLDDFDKSLLADLGIYNATTDKYNFNNIQLQRAIKSILDEVGTDLDDLLMLDLITNMGTRFKAYHDYPKNSDGTPKITWSSGDKKGTVESYIRFGIEGGETSNNKSNVGIDFPGNACGMMKLTTEVTAEDATGKKDSQITGSEAKIKIQDKMAKALDGKGMAYLSAASALSELTKAIVYDTVTPRNYNHTGIYRPNGSLKGGSQPEPNGFTRRARQAMDTNLSLLFRYQESQDKDELAKILKVTGWSSAGLTYFVFAATGYGDRNYMATASSPPDFIQRLTEGQYSNLFDTNGGSYSEYNVLGSRRHDLKTYLKYDKSVSGDDDSSFSSAFKSVGIQRNKFLEVFTSGTDGIMKGWQAMMTGDGSENAMKKLATTGQIIMLVTEIIYIVLTVLIIAMSFGAVGTFYGNPMFMVAYSTLHGFVMPIIALCVFLWGIGATLGVWIPMVPYIMFSVVFLNWLMQVIEAIICAQLYGLTILHPSGDEFGKSSGGLLILLNAVLRPSLMLFGFFIASRLFTTFITYLSVGFSDSLDTIWSVYPIIARILLPLFLYMGVVLAVDTQCFTLIHVLPDKILRWIGGPEEQTDVGAIEKAQGSFDSGSKEVQGAMNKGATAASDKIDSQVDKKQEEEFGEEDDD